ncbi:hypothetical protein [Polyangium jinanense]|uniref:Uncharacterized protein n=1 Tax=Polyangium jinanense TaxID=2829994 RepID=A0A9X3X2A6_9BACT|nr:hypothetical protein [Polyangium jinanense]MDC3956100.1 hypothetical protein [Polyangium jinanense]MDC3982869.1 hypothetical protein [Polyangium jinanense]
MAAIQLYCPFCGQKLSIETEALRAQTTCPRCAKGFVPIDAIPRDQTLPALKVPGTADVAPPPPAEAKAPAKKPGSLAGQVDTILLPPNGGPLPIVPGAQRTAAPEPAAPPVLDGPTLIRAVPPEPATNASEKADALAATVPVDPPAAEPPPVEGKPLEVTVPAAPAVETTAPAGPGDLPPVASDGLAATVNEPEAPAVIPPPPKAAPAEGAISAELAARASTLLGSVKVGSSKALGFEHVALVAAVAAVLSLVLLAVTNVGALRIIGGFFGTISLAATLLAGAAFWLVRSRKDTSAAPAPSSQARNALIGSVVASLVLGSAITGGVAAATGSPGELLRAKHMPPPKLPPKPELPPEQRADYKLKREGHVFVNGGLLHVPPKFRSDDGAFDLYMHFHGNTNLVEESATAAGLNALVYTVNLGNGSGPYEDKFSVVGVLDQTIDKIQETAKKQGLRDARVRRVALGSWSAGYGALAKLLDVAKNVERIDSVLVLDGIHAAYLDPKAKTVDPLRLAPFSRFAKLAAEGKRLFSITHSDIGGTEYASSAESADALLRDVGAERGPAQATPPRVTTKAALTAFNKGAQETRLEQTTEAKKSGMHVRGYSGQTPDQHMAHLVQMSVTVLPELAERWKE